MMTKQAELKQRAYASNLKSRALSILIYLIDRSNKDLTCFPAIPTMAAELHIGISTVKRALHELVDAGFIQKEARFRENNRGQSSNLYTLIFNEEAPEPTSNHDNNPTIGDNIAPHTAPTDCNKTQHITFADIATAAKATAQTPPVPQEQTAAALTQKAAPAQVSYFRTPVHLALCDRLKQMQSPIMPKGKAGQFLPCNVFSYLWTGAESSLMPP